MSKGILWVELSQFSRDRLLDKCPPYYRNVHAHHITLQYGVDYEQIKSHINQAVKAKVKKYILKDGVQLVSVESAQDDLVSSGFPHVTISTDDGVAPVKSLQLLSNPGLAIHLDVNPEIELLGMIRFKEFN